jgi:hypothetical protein
VKPKGIIVFHHCQSTGLKLSGASTHTNIPVDSPTYKPTGMLKMNHGEQPLVAGAIKDNILKRLGGGGGNKVSNNA